ncbi:MAG: MoaD/ThiS family protein [Acidimicrobiia bacterium]|nr:MoaD/ThiS family protein [Acidimicrobiia bacterium]
MTITVRIPTQLRELCGGAAEVALEPGPLADVLAALDAAHPGFRGRLFDDGGELRRFVNVFVAEEDIRFLDGIDTVVADGDVVSIVPAVAGG